MTYLNSGNIFLCLENQKILFYQLKNYELRLKIVLFGVWIKISLCMFHKISFLFICKNLSRICRFLEFF